MSSVNCFEGRTALVTGGALGIGRAIAELIVERGGNVLIADINEQLANAAAEEMGQQVASVRCDVTSAAQVASAVSDAHRRFGGLDILINNAGITRDGMLHKLSEEDWDVIMAVHLKGTFLCTREFARYRRGIQGEAGNAAIVNLSSLAAKGGNAGQLNYVAAKAGIIGMTKTSARELARYGVRVNAVQPGFIDTAMTQAIPVAIRDERIREIPLARPGTVREVANVVAFLASEDASYITGISVEVAGGRLM